MDPCPNSPSGRTQTRFRRIFNSLKALSLPMWRGRAVISLQLTSCKSQNNNTANIRIWLECVESSNMLFRRGIKQTVMTMEVSTVSKKSEGMSGQELRVPQLKTKLRWFWCQRGAMKSQHSASVSNVQNHRPSQKSGCSHRLRPEFEKPH